VFKLGVYRLDQYQDGSRALLSRNRISFQLLRTDVPASPKQVSLFERAIPLVRLSSGVYRTTYRGRFGDLDGFVNALIARRFDRSVGLQFEDWAASDCLTSSEWAASLLAQFPYARLTASDLTLFLIEAALPDGEAFIVEPNCEPIQYIRPPFVIRMSPPEPKLLVVNWLLERYARSRLKRLRCVWNLKAEWLDSEGGGDLEQPPFVFRKIPLVHPEAQVLSRSSGRFAIRKHSVFQTSPDPCDAIRTMNVFNLAYFSRDRLLEGARTVWRSLTPGGIWILGRTLQENPPAHNVTVFLKDERGFRVLDRYGSGSEIEELVLTPGTEPYAP